MKRLVRNTFLIASLFLLSTFFSCKKDHEGNGANGQGFTAYIEQSSSKTHGVSSGSTMVVKWTAYDQIKVANHGGGSGSVVHTYELTSGATSTNGEFYTGEPHSDFFHPYYVAAYPAGKVYSFGEHSVTFDLPDTQTRNATTGTFGEGCNPMVAYSNSQTLQFKNVMGGLAFQLKGNEHVSGIRLTAKNSEKLWGRFSVDCSVTNPTLNYVSGGGSSITLTCDVDLSPTVVTWFYILLPTVNMTSGFTFEVLSGSGSDVVYSHDGPACSIERNTIKKSNNCINLKDNGVINATFTVASGRRVYFSQGNLQYIGSAGSGTAPNPGAYFKFADNQWDILGASNATYSMKADRDLFGWGTSGWNNGNYLYEPYRYFNETSSTSLYTSANGYGYGPKDASNNCNYDLTGTYANSDWGVYNSSTIRNGGGKSWRTLTKDEWVYLVNTRSASKVNSTSDARFVRAMVNDVAGLILFPDAYTHPSTVTLPENINNNATAASANDYSISDWNQMEAAGAVFLPIAGYRDLQTVIGGAGLYWSSTHNSSSSAYRLCIWPNNSVDIMGSCNRYYGCSVRLVCPAP